MTLPMARDLASFGVRVCFVETIIIFVYLSLFVDIFCYLSFMVVQYLQPLLLLDVSIIIAATNM